MRELPSGTVTFLFTDIEGSTKLLHDLGDAGYEQALSEHRRVIREACGRHGGVEADTQGDAFFIAFPTAPGALAAAREAQESLTIPVRMGIHTGAPLVTDEGYVGPDVHKAARIAAAGHGGQVLVSAATAALVGIDALSDLGEHRLKDLSAPERIYQLDETEFPRLRTLHQTNLPVPMTPFLGRERELAEIASLLRRDELRVLTLCGPGGTGKTRLALQAAAEATESYPDGTFWVPLSPLRDPALVLEQVGQAVGSRDGLAEHVADKRLLLVLDNFEQVIDAAPGLSELLRLCPNLKLMVTSRELLRISGEIEYPVPPLTEAEAVDLFCTRARLEPDQTITELCRRLDNLPLALELAAARVRILSTGQLLERVSGRLDLLKGGRDADPRQQTLRATIEWSHELLNEDEQQLFARLAVFRGGCTLEAAEEVADADLDTLQSLVDKSLLRHTGERFWMLETIREFARERLAANGEEPDLSRRCALFLVDATELAAREMEEGSDQVERHARIAAELDNIRAALEWARVAGEEELLLRLVAATAWTWMNYGLYEEEDKWLPVALEVSGAPPDVRMTVLHAASAHARFRGDYARADLLIAEWRRLAEETGDEVELLAAMSQAASTATNKGNFDEARAQLLAIRERAWAIGDRRRAAIATANLGLAAVESGDFETGLACSTDAVELFRELEDDESTAVALINSGVSAIGLSDAVRAEDSFRRALAISARLGWKRGVIASACGIAAALVRQHEEERAVQLLAGAASLREQLGIGVDYEEMHDRALADAKTALGDTAFAAAWTRGGGLTPEELVAIGADA